MLESYSDFIYYFKRDAREDILNFTRKYVFMALLTFLKIKKMNTMILEKEFLKNGIFRFMKCLTGSAKLGYSYHKNKKFDENSDIDVAIVSSDLFNEIMLRIEEFQWKIRRGDHLS
ncbi:MAG: hypothetical protein ACLR5Y_04095 [Haemophilus parainfluenzae]